MLFPFSRRRRIINKAVKKTVKEYSNRTPKIYEHFFYGAFDLAPQYLVIWYLFKTDAELSNARSSGFCNELEMATIHNLISFGYPEEAFTLTEMNVPIDKITFANGTPEEQEDLLFNLSHRQATIAFTTKEDIDNKANGDYHLYFQ